MDYLLKKRQAEVKQATQDRVDYRELLGAIAADGKLSPKDEARLDGILSRLAIQLDSVERDVAILRDHARLTTAIAPRAEIVAEKSIIERDADTFRDKETKLIAELAADAQAINSRLASANSRLAVVDRAVDQLEHLSGAHWQLLGLPDPAVEGSKRHVYQTIFEQPKNAPYSLIALESVMGDPKAFADQFRYDSKVVWTPVAGQTEAELQSLLASARQLVDAGKPARYILPNTDSERPKYFTNVAFFVDLSKRMPLENRLDFNEYSWLAAPGQTTEQFEKCRAAITKKSPVATEPVTAVFNEPRQSPWATIAQA